ncbi:hypothetical protein ACHAP8_009251 [Fusarium lateritium]
MYALTRTIAARLSTPPQRYISRSASTLAVLEVRNGVLSSDAARTVTAAPGLKGPVTALLVGANSTAALDAEAATMKGLTSLVTLTEAQKGDMDKRTAENCASLLASYVRQGKYTHVVAANSVFSRDVVIRAAALNGHQPISDVIAIESEDVFVRPIYAGNAVMTVKSNDDVKYVTVRASAFPATELADESISITVDDKVVCSKAPRSTEWLQEDLIKSDRPELGTAPRVVSGGRGLKSKADFDRVIAPLADFLGASIGASRAAVDSGFADNSLQVGQTGNVVAPELYVAIGISGAIQHLAGMKDSKVIAAINKDADAPIFQVADVGLVGDLFEAVPELVQNLTTK